MIEKMLKEFRQISRDYSKRHFRPIQRTRAFNVYFFSTVAFLIMFLITLMLFSKKYDVVVTLSCLFSSFALLVVSLVSERFSMKHFMMYYSKKDDYVKALFKNYLQREFHINQPDQLKHVSMMISKSIQYQRKNYKFNPGYFSIVLTTIIGFSKFYDEGDMVFTLSLFILFVGIFGITHIVFTVYTNYQNLIVETLEKMETVVNEITLNMLIAQKSKKIS